MGASLRPAWLHFERAHFDERSLSAARSKWSPSAWTCRSGEGGELVCSFFVACV